MVNSVVLVGRLGRDPERKVTPGGAAMCKFAIAVDRPYRSASGEKVTDWLDVVAWRERAEFCGNYLQKGTLVCVQGTIQVRKWESPEGEPRRAWEVQADNVQILSGGRGAAGSAGSGPRDEDAPPAPRESGPGSSARAATGVAEGKSEDAFDPRDDDARGIDEDIYGGE